MNYETQKLVYFYLEVFLMILVIGLLILNFYQMRKKEFACVRNPKQYLVEHFERVTQGNISCTCMTDSPKAFKVGSGTGFKIIFGSFDTYESINQPFDIANITIVKNP